MSSYDKLNKLYRPQAEKKIILKAVDIDNNTIKEIESNDKRIQRLSNLNRDENIINQRLKARREIYKSEIVNKQEKKPKVTREELKKQLLQKEEEVKTEEDELLELLNENQEVTDNEESEIFEEENEILLRPVFVTKENRLTMKEKELIENEYIYEKDEKKRLEEIKKEETKKLINIYIENDESGDKEKEAEHLNMPDDSDDVNKEYEYEQWKIRELKKN